MSVFFTCLTALQSCFVLSQLFLNDFNSFFFRGCFQKAEQIVPAAELCDISCVLSGGFRPYKGYMTSAAEWKSFLSPIPPRMSRRWKSSFMARSGVSM